MSTLTFNYNNWQFWGAYNPPLYLGEQKVVFDGPNKLILVSEDVTSLDFRVDVYSAWKEWTLDPTQVNAKWPEAIVAVGGDPLPGNRVLGTTFFLENGWRMRTWEGDHALTVTGNIFTREGDPVFVSTLNPWTITINLNTSTLVETIIPTLSLGQADIDGVADAVWAEILSGKTAANRLINLESGANTTNIATAVWAEILSGTDAGTRLVNLAAAVDAANTSLTAAEVWNYIIDTGKSQAAGDKLKKIATKTQDLALS